MKFLIFPTLAAAVVRSEQAWPDCGYGGGTTTSLWAWYEHPTDARALLRIPATPEDAQIGLSQAAYDALLTEDERAALVDALPPDWTPEEY